MESANASAVESGRVNMDTSFRGAWSAEAAAFVFTRRSGRGAWSAGAAAFAFTGNGGRTARSAAAATF
eukprot:6293034-Prymnesium_polylepis.1